jgi:glutaredoxin
MAFNKTWLIGAGTLAVIVGIVWWGLSEETDRPAFDASVTTYFYGAECPHCKNVNVFLEENKVAEKFAFEKREVWHDRANQALMKEAAALCGIQPGGMGVPFLFSEGKCLVGEPDVIGFFKQKIGL